MLRNEASGTHRASQWPTTAQSAFGLNTAQAHKSSANRAYSALVPQRRAHQAGTSCQQPALHSLRVLEAHRTAQVLAAAVNRSATQTADGKAAACHAVVDVAAAACQLVCTCPALWRRRSRTKSDLHCAARPRAATEVAAMFGCVRTRGTTIRLAMWNTPRALSELVGSDADLPWQVPQSVNPIIYLILK